MLLSTQPGKHRFNHRFALLEHALRTGLLHHLPQCLALRILQVVFDAARQSRGAMLAQRAP